MQGEGILSHSRKENAMNRYKIEVSEFEFTLIRDAIESRADQMYDITGDQYAECVLCEEHGRDDNVNWDLLNDYATEYVVLKHLEEKLARAAKNAEKKGA